MNLLFYDFRNLKIKISKISNKFILLLLFNFLISSCNFFVLNSTPTKENNNAKKISKINISELLNSLVKADSRLTPVLEYSNNGKYVYRYKKFYGDIDLTIDEIEEWYKLGSDFFIKDRRNIQTLLNHLNNIKVNNSIVKIDNDALGLWIPRENKILLNEKLINKGSRIFLDVLRHESIHVAQSCFSGARNNYPKRIGLPLEFSREINTNLSHKLYSNNSKEGIHMEREAFTYSKIEGAAIKLLKKFCF